MDKFFKFVKKVSKHMGLILATTMMSFGCFTGFNSAHFKNEK